MALHNLKAGELLKSLELGGLPMPSKEEAGYDQYGDIGFIFSRNL